MTEVKLIVRVIATTMLALLQQQLQLQYNNNQYNYTVVHKNVPLFFE